MPEHGGEPLIPFSGIFEQKLIDLPDDLQRKSVTKVGFSPSAFCIFHVHCINVLLWLDYSPFPEIIKTGFSDINLIYFFTAGPDEVAWCSLIF